MYYLLLLIVVVFGFTQTRAAQKRQAQLSQTSFGTETPVKRPVKIPKDVLGQLIAENREQLTSCQENSQSDLSKYFVASPLDINNDGLSDLIIQADEACLQGAHNTPFWIFTRVGQRLEPGYELVFKTQTDWLEIRRTSTNGYRDIAGIGHTAVELFTTVYKFDGQKYQPRVCTIKSMTTRRISRVACDQPE